MLPINKHFQRKLLLICITLLTLSASGQIVVSTQHNDNARTGQNTQETWLTPSAVTWKRFGKLSAYNVDGFIVGQPLYVPGVTFPGLGTYNAIYVATQHDTVYAFDADLNIATPLWQVSFINPSANIVTETIAQQGCPETGYTEVGIMGTPVIDTTTNTLYVVAKTVENGVYVFRLHALDLATGIEKFNGPVQITGSVQNSQGSTIIFTPYRVAQRPGLLLSNGILYIGFGSNGCDLSSFGWVMAYDGSSLQQLGIFNADPNQTYGGSVWQSGSGLAADGTSNVYFLTANGDFDGAVDFGDSFLKLSLSGGALNEIDYFTPFNQAYLNTNDLDLGSGGVVLLPDQPGQVPHLMVGAGKFGTLYVVNRDSLGGFTSTSDNVVQELPSAIPQVSGGGTGAAYWNGNVYYATTKGLRMFTITNGILSAVSIPTSASNISGKGLPSVSANGTSNGILWVLRGATYQAPQLAAYNATNLMQLYSSAQAANGRDTLPAISHFATPTVAAGRVYVGTQSQVVVYGLLPRLNIWYGNNQSAPAGTTLPKPLEIKATNPYTGTVISGTTVTFNDGGAGGTFSSPTAITDTNGIAATTYTLPAKSQTVKVSASAPSYSGATFTETAQ